MRLPRQPGMLRLEGFAVWGEREQVRLDQLGLHLWLFARRVGALPAADASHDAAGTMRPRGT